MVSPPEFNQNQLCVLATANANKVTEIRAILGSLGWEFVTAQSQGVTEEIPETGSTLSANARQKALFVAEKTGQLSLADDTGLEVDALDGAPGVYSARFAGLEATYEDNVNLLLERLGSAPERAARFRTVMVLARPGEVLYEAEGVLEGQITRTPQGEHGFGYDPIFQAAGSQETLAQISPSQKNEISHRRRALNHLVEKITAVQIDVAD